MENKPNSPDLPIRQLIRFSNYSLCITLPKEYADTLSWKQGDRISFQLDTKNQQLILSRPNVQPVINHQINTEPAHITPPPLRPAAPEENNHPSSNNSVLLPSSNDTGYTDLEPIPPLN